MVDQRASLRVTQEGIEKLVGAESRGRKPRSSPLSSSRWFLELRKGDATLNGAEGHTYAFMNCRGRLVGIFWKCKWKEIKNTIDFVRSHIIDVHVNIGLL